MKISHFLFLSSVAITALALVPGTREVEPVSLSTDLKSTFISRNSEAIARGLKKRSGSLQYDTYLPELPDGWPNITAVQARRSSSSSESRDLAIRPRGDLATRDDSSSFGRYLFLGLRIFGVAAAGVTWQSLIQSCEQFSQETTNGIQCVFGAIAQVIAITTIIYQGAVWRGQMATVLNNNGWHIPGINKRDEWASIMARDLSDALKTEVRHLGTWDGIDTNQKRDESGPAMPREVFGVNSRGQDYHFTYLGRDADGKDSFKLGLGDGGFETNNKGRRQTVTDGNFYFSSGGIDFAAQSVEPSSSVEWSWGSTTDQIEFSDIYNSVNCYLGGFFDFAFDYENAISYQVYDAYQDYTLSAGIMSPFSPSQKSGIWSMTIGGGIGNSSCGAF